jgi:hypothetical protein
MSSEDRTKKSLTYSETDLREYQALMEIFGMKNLTEAIEFCQLLGRMQAWSMAAQLNSDRAAAQHKDLTE